MRRGYLNVFLAGLLIVPWSPALLGWNQEPDASAPLTGEEVAERMVQMDKWRLATLQEYAVTRRYVLDNKRFHKHAEMVVRMTYTYPGKKDFEVVSENGSGIIRNRVFRKLLEVERESAGGEAREQTRIIPANYQFQMAGTETLEGRPCYVIEVRPRTDSKLLLIGKIWVDQKDFAIVKSQGQPAKNPSFWTRKVRFVHSYEKHGPFWLAASNRSETEVRIFGSTELTIEYLDYKVNQQASRGGSGTLAAEPQNGSGTRP